MATHRSNNIKKYCWICIVLLMPGGILSQSNAELVDRANKVLQNQNNNNQDEIVESYQIIAASLHMTDMDSAVKVYKKCQEFIEKHQLERHYGPINYQMGEVFFMQSQFEKSEKCFLRCINYLAENDPNLGGVYRRMAGMQQQKGNIDSAGHFAQKSADIRFHHKDTANFSSVYNKLGQIAFVQEKYISAVAYYQEALAYSSFARSPIIGMGSLRNLSEVYQVLGDAQKAEEYLSDALWIAEKNKFKRNAADLKMKLANVIHQNNPAKATNLLLEALEVYTQKKNVLFSFRCHSLLALIHAQNDQLEKSEKYFAEATQLMSEIKRSRYAIEYYQAGGNLFAFKRDFSKSKDYFREMLSLAKESSLYDVEIEARNGLKVVFQKEGKYKEALEQGDIARAIKDSIFYLNQSKIIFDYEARYKKNEQERAIAELNEENDRKSWQLSQQKMQMIYGGLGLLGLIGMVFGLGFAYRQKKKYADNLADKNVVIAKALATNKMLIKEIHHRVKNNLQVVSSLLGLQSRYVEDHSVIEAINTGRTRVQSMSLLHQNLYQGDNLKKVQIKEYFEDLGEHLFSTYSLDEKNIEFTSDIDNLEMDIDVVVPMGLIVNELISNALKHAFKNQMTGMINLQIKNMDRGILLEVSDDGSGIGFNQIPEHTDSLGIQLIKAFAEKLNAQVEIDNSEGTQVRMYISKEIMSEAA